MDILVISDKSLFNLNASMLFIYVKFLLTYLKYFSLCPNTNKINLDLL